MEVPAAPEPYGSPPLCGAKLRGKDATCRNTAGKNTDHVGTGKCWLHGGKTPIKHGRYSLITSRPRLSQLMQALGAEANPLDLMPDLLILRALVYEYIERHGALEDALLAWHASYITGYQEAVKLWREQLAQWAEEQDHGPQTEPPPIPIPQAFESKPKQLPDILSVGTFIDKIGVMVERIQKKEAEQKVTLTDLNRVLDQLGVEVVMALQEVIPDDPDETRTPPELRAEIVAAVERRWGTVRL